MKERDGAAVFRGMQGASTVTRTAFEIAAHSFCSSGNFGPIKKVQTAHRLDNR